MARLSGEEGTRGTGGLGKGWVTNGRGKDVSLALDSGASFATIIRLAPTSRHYSDIFMPPRFGGLVDWLQCVSSLHVFV